MGVSPGLGSGAFSQVTHESGPLACLPTAETGCPSLLAVTASAGDEAPKRTAADDALRSVTYLVEREDHVGSVHRGRCHARNDEDDTVARQRESHDFCGSEVDIDELDRAGIRVQRSLCPPMVEDARRLACHRELQFDPVLKHQHQRMRGQVEESDRHEAGSSPSSSMRGSA